MGAASSAIQLGDLALTWDVRLGSADLSLIDSDLASDLGLETAMLLSLFTDRRAADDDVPPSGDPSDRRGWWADEFAVNEGDLFGSRLWLLDRSTLGNETALRAKEYALECWRWLLDDLVVSSIDITIETTSNGLLILATPQRPGRAAVTFRFQHVWDSP